MSRSLRAVVFLGLVASLPSGCGSVPREAGFPDVRNLLSDRLPQRVHWYQGGPEDAEAERTVRDLLAAPVTVDGAVQIALLRNRSIQATYEDLGIAQADLVQAGLLKNPVFSAGVRFPTSAPGGVNLDFDLVQSFLDILLMPDRKRIAGEEFEAAKLRVADAVLHLAADTKIAYYTAVGARQIADMRRMIARAAEVSADLAQRIYEAGNISELALTLEKSAFADSRADLARAEMEALAARENLVRHMGLWGREARTWTLPDRLPDVPAEELPLDRAESRAVGRRMDLAAARKEILAVACSLGMTGRFGWLGRLNVGAEAERDTDGQWVAGPSLSVQIPIFDSGRPAVARLEALLRQKEHRRAALAVEIRSEVRLARDRLLMNRYRIEHLLRVTIPLRERAVALAMEQWNFMLMGTFELLDVKRHEFDAYQEYIEAVRDYWISRSDLWRAMGGGK